MPRPRAFVALASMFLLLAVACEGDENPAAGPTGGAPTTPEPTGAAPTATTQTPSVVLIVTDDQRWDTLFAMPTVQKELAGRGVEFSNAFVVNPVCCPSRASILTGQYSHTTGVYTNGRKFGGFDHFQDESTIATWLQAAGYRTGLIGKYLNGYLNAESSYIPPGWDEWFALTGLRGSGGYYGYDASVGGRRQEFGSSPDQYSTDLLAGEAEAFIRSVDPADPLFLYFAPHAPHEPATPAPRHEGEFSGLPPHRPPSYLEPDVSDKPEWLQDVPPLPEDEQEAIDGLRTNQLASLLAVDEAIERLLTALEGTGRLENSMVVFTSDNGYHWGEHNQTKKSSAYEESIRVPLVVRFDDVVTAPRKESRLVTNIDLAPTMAQVAGVPAPDVDGASMMSLLRSPQAAWRQDFLIEHKRSGPNDVPTYCAVRNGAFVYVAYETGDEELYDLAADPYQLDNLVPAGTARETLTAMRDRLAELCDPPPPGFSLP
jgi:N-acetylglucosamine-6-sulfatase